MQAITTFVMFFVVVSLAACSGSSDSTDIRTSGVYAKIKVSATEDDQSSVTVTLRVGDKHSNTYLSLKGGDSLQATLNDSFTENIDSKLGSSYQGIFNAVGAGQEGASYRIAFIRPNDTDAPNSTVTMPPAITGFTSSPSDSFSRSSEVLTLTWDPTAQNQLIPISFSGSCFSGVVVPVNTATGIYALNPMTLMSNPGPEESCNVTISATVTNTGIVDTAYGEGGVITATRISSTSVMSTP
jgi:hypothetical protein